MRPRRPPRPWAPPPSPPRSASELRPPRAPAGDGAHVKFFTRYAILPPAERLGWVMARKDPKSMLERSAKALQENAERSGPAAGASYTMIGAIAVCGGLGYGIDYWFGTSPWFFVGGLMFGIVIGMWEIAKIVWHK